MGRPLRSAAGNVIYHVINRANARLPMFHKPADYEAFERILGEAHERQEMRTLAYCIMPNHWHLVLWPRQDGDLPRFMAWLTLTHTQRWHAHHQSAGSGHLYQGRYRSFPVQKNEYFMMVCRYVERNALRAGLARRAEDWRWSSLWRWTHPLETANWLVSWPLERSPRWLDWVNEPQSQSELEALRCCVQRGRPYGSSAWIEKMAGRLRLECTLRPRGRPCPVKGS